MQNKSHDIVAFVYALLNSSLKHLDKKWLQKKTITKY